MKEVSVITVSREFGSQGEEVSEELAKELGYLLLNRTAISQLLSSYGIEESVFDSIDEDFSGRYSELKKKYIRLMHDILLDLTNKERFVLLGRGGQFIFHNFPRAFHLKVVASLETRIKRVSLEYSLDRSGALHLISEQDSKRNLYLRRVFNGDWNDPSLYDLVINTDYFDVKGVVDLVIDAINKMRSKDIKYREEVLKYEVPKDAIGYVPKFAHPSEKEFAKLLDFYQIKWLYEPRSFPLEWDSEGRIKEAFTPDFYLPDFDLYIELTTQRQKLVTYKNKKIRRLRELYPNINIKILYSKDYRNLLRKFGLTE
jgi:cytidylate kinase